MMAEEGLPGFQYTRNESSPQPNRLRAYFENSSFRAQQDQLSLFIKNFPVIRLDDLGSINRLVEQLIRQNEVLGAKCQQNVIAVKNMFGKHEELINTNKGLQRQMNEMKKALADSRVKQNVSHETQERVVKLQEDCTSLKKQRQQWQDKCRQVADELEQVNHQSAFYHSSLQTMGQVLQLVVERNFKKASDLAREMASKDSMAWIDWHEFQRFLKAEKKKQKYLPRVRQTVESFCNRLLRISEFLPASQIREECSVEIEKMTDMLDDMLCLRRRGSSSGLTLSRGTEIHSDSGSFFDSLLQRIAQNSCEQRVSKESLGVELQEVRHQLVQSKIHYDEYLAQLKTESEQNQRIYKEELTQKQQIIGFYEKQMHRLIEEARQSKQQMEQAKQQCLKNHREMEEMQQNWHSMQIKIEAAQRQADIREKQLKQQWQEQVTTYEYKLSQKQEIIEQEQKLRRDNRQQNEAQIRALKDTLTTSESSIKEMTQTNATISAENEAMRKQLAGLRESFERERAEIQRDLATRNSQSNELKRKVESSGDEVKDLRRELEECNRQKSLLEGLVQELRSKTRNVQQKLRESQSRREGEKTTKKELSAIKNSMLAEVKQRREAEQQLYEQQETNQRLKTMIKEMKKELEDVYVQFNRVKVIEQQRQQLMREIEKTQRSREEINQECEMARLRNVQLTHQNKALTLELKHYRSALSRIEMLQ